MRIAIDARKVEFPLSGIGRYTKNLITHLSLIDKENDYVILQNKNYPVEIIQAPNFKTISVNYPAFSVRSLFLLQKILSREKIDLLHSPFIFAPLLAKCKIVLSVYDLIPLRFSKSFKKGKDLFWLFRKLIFRLIFLMVVKRSDSIITLSEAGSEELKKLDRSLNKKIKVIYPASDEIFRKLSNYKKVEEVREKFNFVGEMILYVGMIRPHKNLLRVLEALKLLINEENRHCFLVIGGGKETDLFFLKGMANKFGISKHVFFSGSLTDSEVVALMNAADVFVFPSLEEGFGLPPLEAMACGTPVITSNLSSLPEVVGDAALLVNPYDVQEIASAIKKVLTDPKLRESLIKKGFERVKRFSWEKTAKKTLQIYQEIAGMKR